MNKQVRVNVKTAINAAAIRRERRNGRDYIIVPSATMPDGVVMNGIRYSAEEIEKSFRSLENTPAPLGHPTIEGAFVSASDPEGLARGWIGAWNKNVRRENGRVFIDKVIDVDTASQLNGGKALLSAIEKGEPIHTSTGLYALMAKVEGVEGVEYDASDIVFDHDAILLGEAGAATPEQGVGMLVNKSVNLDGKEIEVVNSALEDAERELDWAADYAARAAEKLDRVPLIERIKSAILETLRGAEREPSSNTGETDMAVSDEQFKSLSDEVKTLSDGVKGIDEQITNAVAAAVKPLTDNLTEVQNAQKAKDDAEKDELVNKIVKANLLDEADAKDLTLNAARALAKKAEPGKAAGATGGLANKQTGGFKLPKAEG